MSASPPSVGRHPDTTPSDTYRDLPKPVPVGKEWLPFLLERCDRFSGEDTDIDYAEYQKRVINEKFYRGEQFRIYTSRIDGSVRIVQPKGKGAARYPHNWIRPMVRTVLAQYVQSTNELGVLPIPDGNATDHVSGAAEYANSLLDSLVRLLMPMDWRIRRWMEGFFSGNKIVYSYWDPRAGIPIGGHIYKPTVKRPRFEMAETDLSPGGYACEDCGYGGELAELEQEAPNVQLTGVANDLAVGNPALSGNPELSGQLGEPPLPAGELDQLPLEPPACPHCGSANLSIEEPVTGQLPQVTGYDDVPLGFIVARVIPRHQLKWDHLAVQFGDSLYIRWRQKMRVEHIREVYPWYEPMSTGKGDDDWSTRTDYELKHSAGNTVQSRNHLGGGKGDPDTRIVDQWWWQPAVYSHYVFPAEFKYGNPENPTVIPAGTKAIDVWPSGLYFVVIDKHKMECADEDFREHLQHTPLDLIPSQISGDTTLDDAISPQRLVNRVKALWLASIENAAGAGMLFRSQYINREDLPSTPFDSAPVKPGVPEKMPLSEVAAFLQPPPVRQDIPAFEEQQRGEMQFGLGAHAPMSGDPAINQVGSGTATAAKIADRGAQVVRSPELALEYAGLSVLGYQWLKLFQKHATEKIWIPFEGKNGMLEGQYFRASDIPDSFIVTQRNTSFIPKYENDRQADFQNALAIAGGIEGIMALSQGAPQLLQEIESRWDVKLDVTNAKRVATIVRNRIDTMTAELEQAQADEMVDPQMIPQLLVEAPEVTPDPEEPHETFIGTYQKLLLDDEMIRARAENPLKVACVHAQIAKHRELMVMQAQRQAMEQMAAAAPQMQMEQQMQQEQMGQQQQMAQEQQAVDVAMGEKQAKAQHGRDMEKEKFKGKQAEKVAATKAKAGGKKK